MPFPVLHAFTGYSIYRLSRRNERHSGWRWALFFVLAANAPDLDFIPGIIAGRPDLFHHGASHSLGAAVLFGLIAGLVAQVLGKKSLKIGLLSFAAYASHLVLDMFSCSIRGLPLLWPLSAERMFPVFSLLKFSAIPAFPDGGLGTFLMHLGSRASLLQFALETLLVGSLWMFSIACCEIRKRIGSRETSLALGED